MPFPTVIVGAGLAGTTLAWHLHFAGVPLLLIDREPDTTASRIAAGLLTPITGQRLAKSWRLDEFFPVAERFYRKVEAITGSSFFHLRPMLRLFRTPREIEIFWAKKHSEFTGLVEAKAEVNPEEVCAPLGGFTMTTAAQLDVPGYLDASREFFLKRGEYEVRDWQGHTVPPLSEQVIFCQGFQSIPNPWFAGVPFQAAQGEILTLRIPGYREPRILNHGIWLAPAADGLYRAGSTYSWDKLDSQPTPEGRAEIEAKLREFLMLPFEVVDHRAAVRPVILESRPRMGLHPQFPNLGFFNGLGSKGSLLAPFFAGQFAEFLQGKGELEPSVDVREFLK
jgi:glycine oxidase